MNNNTLAWLLLVGFCTSSISLSFAETPTTSSQDTKVATGGGKGYVVQLLVESFDGNTRIPELSRILRTSAPNSIAVAKPVLQADEPAPQTGLISKK